VAMYPVCSLQAQTSIAQCRNFYLQRDPSHVWLPWYLRGHRTMWELRLFDVPTLFSFVADVAVYIRFASRTFWLILITCLGHLSVIYRVCSMKSSTLPHHAAASAVHAISASQCFEQIVIKQMGITIQQVASRTIHEFQGFKELCDHELKGFALFSLMLWQISQ